MEEDDRFKFLIRDHKFRPIHHTKRKIQIDSRFQGIFFKKSFQENFGGKRGEQTGNSISKNLRKYYHLPHSERKRILKERQKARVRLQKQLEDSNEQVEENKFSISDADDESLDVDLPTKEATKESDSDSSYVSSDEDSDVDLARGKGNVESSSEEEDDVDEFALEDEAIPDPGWGEMDNEAPRSEDVSKRLALCNMDWDHIHADDLFVLFDSFKPPGGTIVSVTIYPSEFGLKRMAEEERKGPAELKELRTDIEECNKHEEEKFNTEKLRKYELNRLKYYYAVIVCDVISTAESIYNNCDGMEFETSASKLDLRFIPDGMEFNDARPRDIATSLPDPSSYKPASFTMAALNQTKVNLTWDETDHSRTSLIREKFTKSDFEDMDLKDFLASSSGESDDDSIDSRLPKQNGKIGPSVESYRQKLLSHISDTDKKNDIDMEITWEPELLKPEEKKKLNREVERTSDSEDEKEQENEKQKTELEMLMIEEEEGIDSKNMDNFKVDVNDERFSALYNSSKYAIDQSNSMFKKSKLINELVEERQRRLKQKNKEQNIKVCRINTV